MNSNYSPEGIQPVTIAIFIIIAFLIHDLAMAGIHMSVFGYTILFYSVFLYYKKQTNFTGRIQKMTVAILAILFLSILIIIPLPINGISIKLGYTSESNVCLFRQIFHSPKKADVFIKKYYGRINNTKMINATLPRPISPDTKRLSVYFDAAKITYRIHEVCYDTNIIFWKIPLVCFKDKDALSKVTGTPGNVNKIEYHDNILELSSSDNSRKRLDFEYRESVIRSKISDSRIQHIRFIWFLLFIGTIIALSQIPALKEKHFSFQNTLLKYLLS